MPSIVAADTGIHVKLAELPVLPARPAADDGSQRLPIEYSAPTCAWIRRRSPRRWVSGNQPGVGVDPFDLPLVSSNMEMNEGTLSNRTLGHFSRTLNQWLAEYATRRSRQKRWSGIEIWPGICTGDRRRAIDDQGYDSTATARVQLAHSSSGKKGGSGTSMKSVPA